MHGSAASRSKPNYRLTKLNEPYQIGGQKKKFVMVDHCHHHHHRLNKIGTNDNSGHLGMYV